MALSGLTHAWPALASLCARTLKSRLGSTERVGRSVSLREIETRRRRRSISPSEFPAEAARKEGPEMDLVLLLSAKLLFDIFWWLRR
jgi:hypothetical protein